MYVAEIKGKLSKDNENKEDILTSNVFSIFKYAPREIFLLRLAKQLGLEITPDDALSAVFLFWPTYDDFTEPDLVIIIGEYYVLIEAKYFSGFGQESGTIKHQLVRELEAGRAEAKRLNKRFRLVAVTADYALRKAKYKNVPEEIWQNMTWINWQSITQLLYEILEGGEELSPETRGFAEDLYLLLIRKDLRSYQGISSLHQLEPRLQQVERIYFEAESASLRGSFIGFQQSLDYEKPLSPVPDTVFLNQQHEFFETLARQMDGIYRTKGPIFYMEQS